MKTYEQWADCRKTDIEVAEAIFYVASHQENVAERIWQDPSEAEVIAIWEYVTCNGLHDAADFNWGVGTLGTAAKSYGES